MSCQNCNCGCPSYDILGTYCVPVNNNNPNNEINHEPIKEILEIPKVSTST